MIVVVARKDLAAAKKAVRCFEIGRIVRGNGKVHLQK